MGDDKAEKANSERSGRKPDIVFCVNFIMIMMMWNPSNVFLTPNLRRMVVS